MINKNLKIALFSFTALLILSMIYLVFAFIFNIWPFYNERFGQSECNGIARWRMRKIKNNDWTREFIKPCADGCVPYERWRRDSEHERPIFEAPCIPRPPPRNPHQQMDPL